MLPGESEPPEIWKDQSNFREIFAEFEDILNECVKLKGAGGWKSLGT